MAAPAIPSPCIGICKLERDTGLCSGCLRTIEEIAGWSGYSEAERLHIVNALRHRRRARGITSEADQRPRRRRSQGASRP
ncbi:MAG: DUF1289 domain-containing protein [Geminicoccaceae bacterium]